MIINEETNVNTEEVSEAAEYIQMGQVLLGAEKFDDAVVMFDKALNLEPMNKIAYISKGIAFANLESFEKAGECFKRSIKIDKNFADAYYQLGNIEFLSDNFDEGLKNYNQAIALGYNDASIYYNLALAYEEKEDVDEAIRMYNKAALLDEINPEYLVRKASLQILTMKYEEAIQTLSKVINRFPDCFEGYHLTAAAYTLSEQYDKADAILKKATALFPDDVELLFDRIRVLITKGDLTAAEESLKKARELEAMPGQRKEILLNEAKVKGQLDKAEEMKSLLNNALEIKEAPEFDSEIRYFLMNAYLVDKDYQNLLNVAKQVDNTEDEDPFVLGAKYYECLALKGLNDATYNKEFENAVKYYRSISVKDPSRVDAYLFRAMCYKEIKMFDKALEAVDYVLLLQPQNAQLHYIKGNLLDEQGKTEEAKKEHNEAIGLGLNQNLINMLG